WLSEFEHHIVGDIDNRRDRADAAALDALPDPCWRRRAGVDALDDAAAKAGARERGLDANSAASFAAAGRRLEWRLRQRYPGDGGDFARQAEDRQAVGAVRRQLDLEHRVVEVEDAAQVDADRCIRIEQQKPRRIVGQTELAGRAQHPLRLDAAHRCLAYREAPRQRGTDVREGRNDAGRDIRRAANDRHRRVLADVDAAHGQTIGIWMTL